jgi:hypothetical protein
VHFGREVITLNDLACRPRATAGKTGHRAAFPEVRAAHVVLRVDRTAGRTLTIPDGSRLLGSLGLWG